MIFTLCHISYCVDDASATVEMYSDEMPKKTLIFQQDLPLTISGGDLLNKEKANKEKSFLIEQFWTNKNYELIEYRITFRDCDKGTYLIFVNMDKNNENSFFVDLSLPCERLITDDLIVFNIQKDSLSINQKWQYPVQYNYWGGEKEKVNEMSWKCIDLIIHHNFVLAGKSPQLIENNAYKKLYNDIRKHGLEKCLSRLLITRNFEEKVYNFHTLSNSQEEHENISKNFGFLQKQNKQNLFCAII